MNDNRMPVTIITGFLGAGKTTLLNNLIKEYKDKKFAIIENEFGAIGIDGGLIIGTKENIFELSNGCICCSLNDDFYETITTLLHSEYRFDHLLIETTGIADPDSIINAFIISDEMQQHFRIESVICLVDAIHFETAWDSEPEVLKQLLLADVVLLNKVDSVSQAESQALQKLIANINQTATIYPVIQAQISTLKLLETDAFSAKKMERTIMSYRSIMFSKNTQTQHTSLFVNGIEKKLKHDIRSESFVIPGSFDLDKFNSWIQNYLFFNRNSILRIKGILSFHNFPKRSIIQAVKSNLIVEDGEHWADEARFCKLIFIGKKIDRDVLEDAMYQLLWQG